MVHEVTIITTDDCRQEVMIDGKKIQCSGYTASCSEGEIPTVKLEFTTPSLMCILADVEIENTKTLASLMNEKNFKEFCGLWYELHNYTSVP